jgi:hypothetical protein
MRTSSFVRTALVVSVASFLWAACGGGSFEPASKIKGLRVLALQKEPAYPHPGEAVELKLLYWDGKASERTTPEPQFNFFTCDNPNGDLYTQCFTPGTLIPLVDTAPPAPVLDAGPPDAADMLDASGSADASDGGAPSEDARIVIQHTIIPNDPYVQPKIPTPYGLRYVFFTACAGHIGPDNTPNSFPVACFDGTQKLGPDDFVPGYSAIYVYETLRNTNPVVAPELDIPAPAVGPDGLRHIQHCTQSDRSLCPAYNVNAVVDIAQSAEIDPEANDGKGSVLREQLWVTYYSTDGDFTSSIRLVNDATTGPNPDHGTKYRAPITPGLIHLFGIVHDNRGGVAWALGKFMVD